MERRNFLNSLFSLSTLLFLKPNNIFKNIENFQNDQNPLLVEKVHLIFKTHLDIGFTDLAENVLRRYFDYFIPKALTLAENLRHNNNTERFVWTTGAWLIYEYLERASSKARINTEKAIFKGDICWHGLPFTTHSELLDDSLFLLGTRISAELDKRFGKKTIAAKMTDVPSHSIGIVPQLENAGLSFLHIGVNPASTPPKVPPLFRWQASDGSEINVMYQKDYGSVMIIPGTNTAIALSFTGDNHGPQSLDSVFKIYDQLKKRFPNALITASTLNDVAREVKKIQNELPIVKQELGDTWIHGVGSDPWKIARFRELSRLRKHWINLGKLNFGDELDLKFGIPLLKIAEHTWGLDVKTHLKDWGIYLPKDFMEARHKDNFQKIEKSWDEKRNYLGEAINSLPNEYSIEAKTRLNNLNPTLSVNDGFEKLALKDYNCDIDTSHFIIALDPQTGALIKLYEKKRNRDWASQNNPLGLFSYQTFSIADYNRFFEQYLTQKPDWAISDFGKPGIENFNLQSKLWLPRMKETYFYQSKEMFSLIIKSEVLDNNSEPIGGSPRLLKTRIDLLNESPTIKIDFQWYDKPAYRFPEALWFSFNPKTTESGSWRMDKMGQKINPNTVVTNGNRNLHGVIDGVYFIDKDQKFNIETLDAPLVAPGKQSLLNFDNLQPKTENGMHFCLSNNVWGTNFVMWFDDNMRYRFVIRSEVQSI